MHVFAAHGQSLNFILTLLLLVLRPFTVAAVSSSRHHAIFARRCWPEAECRARRRNAFGFGCTCSWLVVRDRTSSWRFAQGVAEEAAPSGAHALPRIKLGQRPHIEHDVAMLHRRMHVFAAHGQILNFHIHFASTRVRAHDSMSGTDVIVGDVRKALR